MPPCSDAWHRAPSRSGVPRLAAGAAAALLGLSAGLCSAQAPPGNDWQDCVGVSSDSDRLACYDSRAGRSMMMALPSSTATATWWIATFAGPKTAPGQRGFLRAHQRKRLQP